jgi:tRNA-modifying protein YgfZ
LKQDNSSGYAALREGAGLIEAAVTGRIRLIGTDRRSYLQGLLTNDVAALTPGTGCYAAMLTAQGRMITDMRVLELGDAVLLDVPAGVTAPVRDHLDRFIFSEDVQAEDVTGTLSETGLYGPRALEVLKAAGTEGDLPSTVFHNTRVRVAGTDAVLVRSDDAGVAGYDLLVNAADTASLVAALIAAGAVRATPQDAEVVRIESGRPRFGVDMDTDTIPLEAGLEDRAISRSKGCYVGQEVIVRVQDRGHGRVARRLVALLFDAAAAVPVPGARVTSGEREIGRITSSAFSPTVDRPVALGYVGRDFAEPGTRVNVADAGATVATPGSLIRP